MTVRADRAELADRLDEAATAHEIGSAPLSRRMVLLLFREARDAVLRCPPPGLHDLLHDGEGGDSVSGHTRRGTVLGACAAFTARWYLAERIPLCGRQEAKASAFPGLTGGPDA